MSAREASLETPSGSAELRALLVGMGKRAKTAARTLRQLDRAVKDRVLQAMADELLARTPVIVTANERDLDAGRKKGLSAAMLDRLRLDEGRLAEVAGAVRSVADLPDPVGDVLRTWTRPNGLEFEKVRVPIGVIGMIYESRPNVTCDAAALCFKSGNATLLRGGSEAIHTNLALAEALQEGGEPAGLPVGSIQLVPRTDRFAVRAMCELDDALDLIIPRGGHQLIETVVAHARMPVIKHYDGVCHLYVDKAANLEMAGELVLNSKVQRPGVCNALETLLVHRDVAALFLPVHAQVVQEAGVELRGDERVRELVPEALVASEEDWTAEYLDLVLAVRVVDGLESAIDHIERYGSHHTDVIVTDDEDTAQQFMRDVDSAVVLCNASTRFNDGGEFGFGAEIGISTDRLHARGPMGLEELTSYKYKVRGTGQTR